jgi:Xaa-Pro aminopeptidase
VSGFAEDVRARELLAAQDRAAALFDAVVAEGLLAPGRTELEVSDAIRELAAERFDVNRFWHKRIVRAGVNTLEPYAVNPPDRTIADDDVVFLDFGPIFADWESDFGRTYVLGEDPAKLALRDALPVMFAQGRAHFEASPDITGAQLYEFVVQAARDAGYEFGATHAGHLVGEFPHEKIAGDKQTLYITPGSDEPMRRVDRTGRICHWILEIHLVDRARGYGGFVEELLDL